MFIKVDPSELVKIANRWGKRAANLHEGDIVVSALNKIGDEAVENLLIDISRATGLNIEAARRLVSIRKAARNRHSYEIDVGQALIRSQRRPLPKKKGPKRDDTGFYEGQLVNIVTMGDDRVCELCEELALNSPYTIEEARAQLPHHPNCRCVVEDFGPKRRNVVEMQTARQREAAAQQNFKPSLSMAKLREMVTADVKRIVRVNR